MSKAKRKIEVVDLSDDNSIPAPSRSKFSKPSSSFSPQGRAPLPTPPSSSQPTSSSQNRYFAPRSDQNYGNYTPVYSQPSKIHSTAERESRLTSAQEQEREIVREIDLTEDFDDDVYENYRLYGILNTEIVGYRFYDGQATVGEYVKVRREPGNPYDGNAIRIDNVGAIRLATLEETSPPNFLLSWTQAHCLLKAL